MNRADMMRSMRDRREPWDIVTIGGGATGLGIAVDAASRGYDVLLLEQNDFGKGTSSRSTKLVHGGVRYLRQGNLALVMEALKERGILRQNAPHLVHDLRFVIPIYRWRDSPYYTAGLKFYDMLAGRAGFGPSCWLRRRNVLQLVPTLRQEGLLGGVQYYDGQFDDARLLINLARTAVDHGAVLINYAAVIQLLKDRAGKVNGVVVEDRETDARLDVSAKVVINATGPFTDTVRRMDDPGARAMIALSQGIHVVLDRSFLPGDTAVMVPKTSDGRVMFAIPWHGHTVVGTTDTPVDAVTLEPTPRNDEITYLLSTAAEYLARPPGRADVLSVFSGIRPLVKRGEEKDTAALSRGHTIQIGTSGLVTICGGKWTTYRNMAEDCVNQAAAAARLARRPCVTRDLRIHGHHANSETLSSLAVYGADAAAIEELVRGDAALGQKLHGQLPYLAAEVVWAARMEMARTLDDVLSRRTRALQLNARAALEIAPRVAALMAAEIGRDDVWQRTQIKEFTAIAQGCLIVGQSLRD